MNDKVKLTGIWQNTSRTGKTYFVGALGGAKLLILENNERQSDKDPTHIVFVVPREQSSRGVRRGQRREAGDEQRSTGRDSQRDKEAQRPARAEQEAPRADQHQDQRREADGRRRTEARRAEGLRRAVDEGEGDDDWSGRW